MPSPALSIKITFQPSGLRARVPPGTDVAEAARSTGIEIGGACGGVGTCGKCRVLVVKGRRRYPELACQCRPKGPTVIEIPPGTLSGAASILTEGVYVHLKPRPGVRILREGKKAFLEHAPPLASNGARPSELTKLAGTLRPSGRRGMEEANFGTTPPHSGGGEVTWMKHQLKTVPGGCYGVALDLGTTTLVATLFDLESGKRIAVASDLDPQVSLGEDVVSRLSLAVSVKDGAHRLRTLLLAKVNELIGRTCREAGVPTGDVFDVCAVGNTFMHHSFLGLALKGLSEAPFSPVDRMARELSARELELGVAPLGRAYVPPVVAGFLGPDALAGALVAGLDLAKEPTLYIDLGTNGEILLAAEGQLLGATTAAGPAFEGAQIECGMRAAAGAVSSVRLIKRAPRKGVEPFKVELGVIGGGAPRGLAGSGLVMAVAELLKAGALDGRGTFIPTHPLVERGPAGTAAVLAAGPRRIHVSQSDVRNLQLAKAAISAGTKLLLSNANLEDADLDRVLLAGAFGNFLDRESAKGIGLLPDVELRRVLSLGNAASTGAGMMLVSLDERRRAEVLAKRIEHIELAGDPAFRDLFVDCLAFPE